jgi:hypothetical protein
MLGTERGQREAAVAREHGRHAVPDGRGAELVPEGLGVIVRVEVDDPGRHEEPIGIDGLRGGAGDLADLDDDAVLDRDVRAIAREPGSVHHHAALDHEVVRHPWSSGM